MNNMGVTLNDLGLQNTFLVITSNLQQQQKKKKQNLIKLQSVKKSLVKVSLQNGRKYLQITHLTMLSQLY